MAINNRNLNDYKKYVCPICFYQSMKCKCGKYLPHLLIFIDENIQEHIRLLNRKGYITASCCEGHYNDTCGTTIHIGFSHDYDIFDNIPKGFKYLKKRKLLEYYISPKYNKEKMENIKNRKLSELLQWVRELPSLS